MTLNLGAGYTAANGALRIEGYVANLLDEDATTKAQFAPGLNLRFLNDPRFTDPWDSACQHCP